MKVVVIHVLALINFTSAHGCLFGWVLIPMNTVCWHCNVFNLANILSMQFCFAWFMIYKIDSGFNKPEKHKQKFFQPQLTFDSQRDTSVP